MLAYQLPSQYANIPVAIEAGYFPAINDQLATIDHNLLKPADQPLVGVDHYLNWTAHWIFLRREYLPSYQ